MGASIEPGTMPPLGRCRRGCERYDLLRYIHAGLEAFAQRRRVALWNRRHPFAGNGLSDYNNRLVAPIGDEIMIAAVFSEV